MSKRHEMMALKGKLKAVKNTIERLKRDLHNSGKETLMLRSKLSLVEVQLGFSGSWLW